MNGKNATVGEIIAEEYADKQVKSVGKTQKRHPTVRHSHEVLSRERTS